MDASRLKEVIYLSSSPPYADPLVILSGSSPTNANPLGVLSRTRSSHFYDPPINYIEAFISSLLIFVFLLVLIYEISLACFNCGFENNNFGWIRASFFMNIPFVVGIFVYIVTISKDKKIPSFSHFLTLSSVYAIFVFIYSIAIGVYVEGIELESIRVTLHNATMINLLPCPMSYYLQLYAMKIIHLCLSCMWVFIIAYLYCVVSKWRSTLDTIFQRHKGETVIEHFY